MHSFKSRIPVASCSIEKKPDLIKTDYYISMCKKLISLLIMLCMLFVSLANSAETVLIFANQQSEQGLKNTVSCHGDSQSVKQQDSLTLASVHMTDASAKLLHDCCMASPCLLPTPFQWDAPLQSKHVKAIDVVLILPERSENPYKPPSFSPDTES